MLDVGLWSEDTLWAPALHVSPVPGSPAAPVAAGPPAIPAAPVSASLPATKAPVSRPSTPVPDASDMPIPPAFVFRYDSARMDGNKEDEDELFGHHPALPNGFVPQGVIRYFDVGTHSISSNNFDLGNFRAYLVWEVQEATFRFQLRALDVRVLKSMLKWTDEMKTARESLWPKCWGGLESFVPGGVVVPVQTHELITMRLSTVYSMLQLVREWPRTSQLPQLQDFTSRPEGLTLGNLLEVEAIVWKFYAQTYFDYFALVPQIPATMPSNPLLLPPEPTMPVPGDM